MNVDSSTFNVLSLCAGIEGLGLAVRLAVPNARTICVVEREAYCCEVLARRMQEKLLDDCPIWTNLATFDGLPWCGVVDCVIAGYPCQPFSVAGKQLGKADPRHLWPHVARIIGECKPTLVFLENVPGHVLLGLSDVANDLSGLGCVVPRPILLEAAQVGASQRRERLFVLAYHPGERRRVQSRVDAGETSKGKGKIRSGRVRKQQRATVDEQPELFGEDMADAGRTSDERRDDAGSMGGVHRAGESEGDQRERSRNDIGDSGSTVEQPRSGRRRQRLTGRGADRRTPAGETGGATDAMGDTQGIHDGERQRFGECPTHGTGSESGVEGSSQRMGDAESIPERKSPDEADAIAGERRAWGLSGGTVGNVDDADDARHAQAFGRTDERQPEQRSGQRVLGDGCGDMANDDAQRERGLPIGEGASHTSSSSSSIYGDVPYWPPGPAARDEWQRILAVRPDLAPAVETPAQSKVRGMASGLPGRLVQSATSRVDELRALGNAVIPVCGAAAFLILLNRLKEILEKK